MADVVAVLRFVGRSGKRVAVTVAGGVMLFAGLVMLVTPGPGILVVIAGLAVLSTEYIWARRALDSARRRARVARGRLRKRRSNGG